MHAKVCLFVSQARPSQVSLGANQKSVGAMKSFEDIGGVVQYEFKVRHHFA